MAIATITLTDDPDGSLDMQINFGDIGVQNSSFAHQAAARMLVLFREWIDSVSTEDEPA